MNVLVGYKQVYIHKALDQRPRELLARDTRMFEAASFADLASKFSAYQYTPRWLEDTYPGELQVGRKTMLWYLPETGKRDINQDDLIDHDLLRLREVTACAV